MSGCFGWSWPPSGDGGGQRSSWSNQRRSSDGIATGSVGGGLGTPDATAPVALRSILIVARLIADMAAANPLWGAPRIHGELRTLGIAISERTVSRLLANRSRPPSQTWRTFLGNHVSGLVSMDFFTVSTLTGRVLFVLVLMAHDRRRIVHVNVTEHPTAAWTAQQVVEAFPEDSAPRWLLRDRDSIYDDQVRRRIASLGITEVIASPRSPWQNPTWSA